MLLVQTAEFGEKLASLDLQTPRQAAGGEKGLFQFDHCFTIKVYLENKIGLGIEVGIHRRSDGKLHVLHGKSILAGVMGSSLEMLQGIVCNTGTSSCEQAGQADFQRAIACAVRAGGRH